MPMKLHQYLKRERISNAEFARKIGVSRISIWRYSKGVHFPRWEFLTRIMKETNGEVTYLDFCPDIALVSNAPDPSVSSSRFVEQ